MLFINGHDIALLHTGVNEQLNMENAVKILPAAKITPRTCFINFFEAFRELKGKTNPLFGSFKPVYNGQNYIRPP